MAAMAETNGTGRFLGEFEFGFKRELIDDDRCAWLDTELIKEKHTHTHNIYYIIYNIYNI